MGQQDPNHADDDCKEERQVIATPDLEANTGAPWNRVLRTS